MTPRTDSITREHLALDHGDALPLTVVRGAGEGAAVVIMPAAFGVADDLVTQMRALADSACAVLTWDPFFRVDDGPVPYTEMPRVMKRIGALDPARFSADLRAVLSHARAASAGRGVVMVGVCAGGPFALHAAADGLVDAVAVWHGSRLDGALARAAEMRAPMRFHFGAVDPFVPVATIDAVRAAFAGRHDVEVFVHEGATHGFSHPTAPAWNAPAERAAMDSVRALVELLRTTA